MKEAVLSDIAIKFTIHFATINTSMKGNKLLGFGIFTIHFATINTVTHFTQCL